MFQKFKVLRAHIGDRNYNKGDVREADPRRVQCLVDRGVLAEMSPKKASKKPSNKVEPQAKNKAAPAAENKSNADDAAPGYKAGGAED